MVRKAADAVMINLALLSALMLRFVFATLFQKFDLFARLGDLPLNSAAARLL